MATVDISHDDRERASVIGPDARPTGRLRWWKGLNQERVLQAEWRSEYGRTPIWIDIPTVTEIKD